MAGPPDCTRVVLPVFPIATGENNTPRNRLATDRLLTVPTIPGYQTQRYMCHARTPAATVPKGLSGQWLSQAFSVELYKWLTRVCWEALGIQCRCPDTGCARGDDGRALWAIDVA